MNMKIAIVVVALLVAAGIFAAGFMLAPDKEAAQIVTPTATVPPTVEATPTPIGEVIPTATPTPTITPTASPTSAPTPVTTYSYYWHIGEWSSCSLACGGGTQERTVICQRNDFTVMDDSYCPLPKPITAQECNTQACPTPTPVSWPTLQPTEVPNPVLLNVTWTDTNDNDSIDADDLLAFTFSKPMDTETIDGIAAADVRLIGYTGTFGSVGRCEWSSGDTIFIVTLGADCSTNLGGKCFNPTSDVKDKDGRADATVTCVPVTQ